MEAIAYAPRDPAPRPAPARGETDETVVRQLRRSARIGQLSPRFDLDRLAAGAEGSPDLWGAALLQAAGSDKPVILHRSRAGSVTEAECWLSRLIEAVATGDAGSARFLTERRLPRRDRRLAILFAQRLATAISAGNRPPETQVAVGAQTSGV